MASLCKTFLILFFFFISAYSNEVKAVERLGFDFSLGFGGIFGGHNGGVDIAIGNQQQGHDRSSGAAAATTASNNSNKKKKEKSKPDFKTKFSGVWKIDNRNAGVAAMQLQLMPNGKVVWFDTTNLGPSAVQFSPQWCRPLPNDPLHGRDCYAHAIEYDPVTSTYRTLKLMSDPWCSTGALQVNGDLIVFGGAIEGMRAVRSLSMQPNSQFQENQFALAADRWYPSQQMLEDGSFIVVGGRNSFSYELVPPNTIRFPPKLFDLPLLKETNDEKENNLYPFLYLLPDGNVYLFANYKSIILNPRTGQVVRQLPDLAGGARNYPPSAMSALLPLVPGPENTDKVQVEVVICGGNIREAAKYSEFPPRTFIPALKDCNRMVISDPNPTWDREDMPSRRIMGDMLYLPTGDLLMLNGAQAGSSAWDAAEDPNFVPVLYRPYRPKGKRFKLLKPSQIARMYHSSSTLLPDGKILVAGSNPNQFYNFTSKYPTELRVEKFSPHYLAPELDKHRPVIDVNNSDKKLKYGQPFKVKINLKDKVGLQDIKVTMIAPPFTTHGFSQNQRLIVVTLRNYVANNKQIDAVAPPNARIAPPGYYLLFVVHRGVPSSGIWVHID